VPELTFRLRLTETVT